MSPAEANVLLDIARARLALHDAAAAIDPLNTDPAEREALETRISQLLIDASRKYERPYRADTGEGQDPTEKP